MGQEVGCGSSGLAGQADILHTPTIHQWQKEKFHIAQENTKIYIYIYCEKFQSMASTPNNNSLSLDQDTNWFFM